MRIPFVLLTLLLLLAGSISSAGARQFTSQEDFLAAAFARAPASPQLLWLDEDVKAGITRILGHPYGGMRIRYWSEGDRIAWVLDEIGKEEPITIGVVTEQNRVTGVTVLEFRESRGGEVRYESFTRQFIGARLDQSYRLDRHIDGITGATLSVWAVTRVTELALYLSQQVNAARPAEFGAQALVKGK